MLLFLWLFFHAWFLFSCCFDFLAKYRLDISCIQWSPLRKYWSISDVSASTEFRHVQGCRSNTILAVYTHYSVFCHFFTTEFAYFKNTIKSCSFIRSIESTNKFKQNKTEPRMYVYVWHTCQVVVLIYCYQNIQRYINSLELLPFKVRKIKEIIRHRLPGYPII